MKNVLYTCFIRACRIHLLFLYTPPVARTDDCFSEFLGEELQNFSNLRELEGLEDFEVVTRLL